MPGRAVVFDFDGTVVDTELPVYQGWAELYAANGHELDLAFWQTLIGTDGRFDPAADLATRLGRPLTEDVLAARRARRDELLHANPPRPGVLSWLDAADELGLPLAIASSSPSEWVDHHLTRLGLLARFAFVACAGEDLPPKPAPDVYLAACDAVGADPRRSIAVEDSPNGITAAKAAGLFTVAVPHSLTEALDLSAADLVVPSLAALPLATAVAHAAATTA
jgi:HAD superfamily hydrolase (TIGR01509 family)